MPKAQRNLSQLTRKSATAARAERAGFLESGLPEADTVCDSYSRRRFAGGGKEGFRETTLKEFLDAGISVVSVNYRYYQQAPLPAALHDCRRALQFVRSKATEWNLDKSRVGAFGGSAGAITSMYLAFHDDMANPASNDPVERESTRLMCVATTAGQTTLGGDSPRSPFDPPWRIGEFFGEEAAIDVLSQQTGQFGDGVVWDEALQCWAGDSPTLVASLQADRRFRKPVLNTENGYEYLRGQATEKKQVHHTDKVRRSAWRIACAGGYFAAGFHGTIGHSDVWNRIDAPNHYTFTLRDEGAAAQLGLLHDFFATLPFWRMQPFTGVTGNAVALADLGKCYVVYLPQGGTTTVALDDKPGNLNAWWFNPRDG